MNSADKPATRSIVWIAWITAAVVLAVYVRTLAPGLVAITDTPKFQFIGRILGTAHNPGYPLYVVISHLFGYLPFGNLAWRINLMSALFGAGAIGWFVLTAMAIGCRSSIAVPAGLALAFGSSFWLTGTIAEVYSLHIFLVSAMTYALVRWRKAQRASLFFAALGVFALALGHHTTIVLLVPAVAAFAILTAPAFATRPRTIAIAALVAVLGLCQYLFIIVRTRQGAWGESPASTLGELVDVVRGAQFVGALQPIALETLMRRGPLMGRIALEEVSPVVCLLAAAGLVAVAIRDRAFAAMAVLALAALGFFGIFYDVTDLTVFMLPAYFFLWLLAAAGATAVADLTPGRRWMEAAAAVALVAVAGQQFTRNVVRRDLSHDRSVMRYFDGLFAQLPERSAIVNEDFLVDRMVFYKTLGEQSTRGRDVRAPVAALPDRIAPLVSQGYGVFAFEKSANGLRRSGLEFEYTAWPLTYGPIRQFLEDQPAGTVVAIAVPSMHLGAALQNDAVPLDAIGGAAPQAAWTNVVAIGVVGARGALQGQSVEPVSVYALHGTTIGTSGVDAAADIGADATYEAARIRVGAREIIRSTAGPVVAVWDRHGAFLRAFAVAPDGRVPMQAGALSVHRLRGIRKWVDVPSAAPLDITTETASGHLMVKTGGSEPLVIYAASDGRLSPIVAENRTGGPSLDVQALPTGEVLRQWLERDGWPADPSFDADSDVLRIEVPASDDDAAIHVAFGGIPRVVLARSGRTGNARLYGLDLRHQLEPIDARTDRLHFARDHHEFFLGSGWSPVAADSVGPFRAVGSAGGELTIPCERGACLSADFQLRPVDLAGPAELFLNEVALGAQTIRPDWNRYTWTLPASAIRDGMNSLVIKPSVPLLVSDVVFGKEP